MAGKLWFPLLTVALVACLLAGCQSHAARTVPASGSALATRNNCYSLLDQLLNEEKDVSFLRFIKREHMDVKTLVIRIAKNSGEGAKLLENLAKRDPSIDLHATWLPPGELKTREAISKTKQHLLLSNKGDRFELTLLLTQTEALNYACHLARVAAEYEPNAENARALNGLSQQMEGLYSDVFEMVLSKTR